jgi:arginase
VDIALTNVHLDLGAGRRGTDMGPSALHVAGLLPALQRLGHAVVDIASLGTPSMEAVGSGASDARFLASIAEVVAALADRVEQNVRDGRFPLVLGGDHSVAVGTVSGMARAFRARGERLGVVWVDAHTDMNTPATSPTGNVHGMPLACLLGEGPASLTTAICGSRAALRPEDVAILGVRDVDATESEIVRRLGVRVFTMSELDARGIAVCLREAIDRVTEHTAGVHLSFDLDGVDPQHAPGVGTPVPGGLSLRESHLICEWLARETRLCGMELVELNPTRDVRNQTAELGRWLIESALGRRILR